MLQAHLSIWDIFPIITPERKPLHIAAITELKSFNPTFFFFSPNQSNIQGLYNRWINCRDGHIMQDTPNPFLLNTLNPKFIFSWQVVNWKTVTQSSLKFQQINTHEVTQIQRKSTTFHSTHCRALPLCTYNCFDHLYTHTTTKQTPYKAYKTTIQHSREVTIFTPLWSL